MISTLPNSGISAKGFTALLMVSIPIISMAKPAIMEPISFLLSFLEKEIRLTPIMASTGEKEDGFKSCTKKLPLSMPERLKSHAVIVVPTLAPIITLTACSSRIIPEFTNPTTITVVAEEDWITAVTPAPTSTAFTGLLVSFSRMLSSLPPEAFESPSPIRFIPYKNRARPPIIVSMLKKSISTPSLIINSLCPHLTFYNRCPTNSNAINTFCIKIPSEL